MTGSVFGWAVIAVVRRPSKSNGPTVPSSGVSTCGKLLSTNAMIRPAWAMTCVFATPTEWSTRPVGPIIDSPARAFVRTQRLRYHSARPSRSRIPCTIPWPVNQCRDGSPGSGFGPLRRYRPTSSGGRTPSTGRSTASISSGTGAR